MMKSIDLKEARNRYLKKHKELSIRQNLILEQQNNILEQFLQLEKSYKDDILQILDKVVDYG